MADETKPADAEALPKTVLDDAPPSVPETALANEPVMVTLAGREYPFKEPGNRRATQLLSEGLRIMGMHSGVFNEEMLEYDGKPGSPAPGITIVSQMCEAIEAIYPFLYDVLELSEDARADIDNKAMPAEIILAFNAINKALRRPFAGFETTTEIPTPSQTMTP